MSTQEVVNCCRARRVGWCGLINQGRAEEEERRVENGGSCEGRRQVLLGVRQQQVESTAYEEGNEVSKARTERGYGYSPQLQFASFYHLGSYSMIHFPLDDLRDARNGEYDEGEVASDQSGSCSSRLTIRVPLLIVGFLQSNDLPANEGANS